MRLSVWGYDVEIYGQRPYGSLSDDEKRNFEQIIADPDSLKSSKEVNFIQIENE